jgi:hypothetical protein
VAPTGGRSSLEADSRRDPSARLDCVDRRKLDFFDAAKLLLLGHVGGEEATLAGGQDDHAWSFQIGIAVRRRGRGKSDGRTGFEHKHETSYTISKQQSMALFTGKHSNGLFE